MKNYQSILYLTPRGTYYNSKKDVVAENERLHSELFNADRELYTLLLYFKNATYYTKSLIVQNLLSNSLHKKENSHIVEEDPIRLQIEDDLIYYSLMNENITHALKLLLSLKDKKINNARTKKLILKFLFKRGNTDLISIKYKKKIKKLLIHALSYSEAKEATNGSIKFIEKFNKSVSSYSNPYSLEVLFFVFDKDIEYKSQYFKEYVETRELFKSDKFDLRSPSNLPIEVLTGFNSTYFNKYTEASLCSVGKLSDKQKIQKQNLVARQSNESLKIKIDLNKYSIIELLKYMYNKADIDKYDIMNCRSMISRKALDIKDKINKDFLIDLADVGVIVDFSSSNDGNVDSKKSSFYKIISLMKIFSNSRDNIFICGGKYNKKGFVQPNGHTDLSSPLLDAVESGFRDIIVLSDGFENVNNFDKVYKQLINIGINLNVIHFNPVFNPKNYSFKSIGEDVSTFPFSSEKDLEDIMALYLLRTNIDNFKKTIRYKVKNGLLNK